MENGKALQTTGLHGVDTLAWESKAIRPSLVERSTKPVRACHGPHIRPVPPGLPRHRTAYPFSAVGVAFPAGMMDGSVGVPRLALRFIASATSKEKVMRRSAMGLIGLLFLAGVARAAEPQGKIVRDLWDAAYLDGTRTGFFHTTVTEVDAVEKRCFRPRWTWICKSVVTTQPFASAC